jgi:hypothetical protein
MLSSNARDGHVTLWQLQSHGDVALVDQLVDGVLAGFARRELIVVLHLSCWREGGVK